MNEIDKTICISRSAVAKLYNLKKAIRFLNYWQKVYKKGSKENQEVANITIEYAQREVDKLKKEADIFCNRFSNYSFSNIVQLRILLYH